MEHNTELIQNNNFILQMVQSKCISKRLNRELISMYKLYDEVNIELNQNSNEICVNVYEIVDNKKVWYKFAISPNYPFVCPSVFLNNHKYKSLLASKTSYEITYLKKLKGIDCFCCSSLTCSNNWAPSSKLNDIINEIKYFKKMKKDLILKIFADKIKLKYLVADIDLDSWF